jgi:hypothetical protein
MEQCQGAGDKDKVLMGKSWGGKNIWALRGDGEVESKFFCLSSKCCKQEVKMLQKNAGP